MSTKTCPVCANGDKLSAEGAHKCIECRAAIHAIDPCSFPLDGDEEKRVCPKCNSKQGKI